jgi:hypothetical protein
MTDDRIPLTPAEARRLAAYDRAHHGGRLADLLDQIADGVDTSAVWRPAQPGEHAPPLDTVVSLNPVYGWMCADGHMHHTYTAQANGGVPGQIAHTQVPGGFWAVKVRHFPGNWTVFAVPRRGTVGEPFTIATSPFRLAALLAGIGWANSASAAVIRLDRIVFAGLGDATEETPIEMAVPA